MVTVPGFCGPVVVGVKSTINLHFFFGNSSRGQLLDFVGNENVGKLVTSASGFPNVIGGPLLAELLRVNV